MIASAGNVANQFKIEIWSDATTKVASKDCHFTQGSNDYIRDQLNTNPQKLNASNNFGTTNVKYFLGQTYEQAVADQTSGSQAAMQYGMILPLQSGSFNLADHRMNAQAPKTGWFINRKPGQEELFRLISLHKGEWFQNNYELFVEDLSLGDRLTPSSFSLVLKDLNGSAVESYRNLTLDASSDNYIGKRIGNQSFSWNATDLKYDVRGKYINKSDYFYVEVSDAVANNTLDDTLALPMGFNGPLQPKKFKLVYGSSGPNAWSDGVQTGTKANTTITISDTPAEPATITMVVPSGTYVITTTNTGGTTDATFSSGAANVDRQTSSGVTAFALAVATLLNTLDGYTVTASGGSITVTADDVGSHWSFTLEDANDGAGRIAIADTSPAGTDTDDVGYVSVKGNDDMPHRYQGTGQSLDNALFCAMPTDFTASVKWPGLRLTTSGSNKGGDYRRSEYFGIRHHKGAGASRSSCYADLVYALPANDGAAVDHHQSDVPSTHERSFIFHLEDVKVAADPTRWYYSSGSYDDGTSVSKLGSGASTLLSTARIKQYRAAFWGGFDGLDIKEVEPFSNRILSGKEARTHYGMNTVMKALDMVRDPEVVEMDMLSMPGATLTTITDEILEVATGRGDALAIIDVESGYQPSWEGSGGSVSYGTIADTLSSLETRQLNNSYGACYYPWVVIRDSNADVVPVPSSVAAIGALAKSSADSEVWFAPAGFNRGGIKNLGSNTSGLVVTHTIEHLTKDNRDDLYALNVNPIARFPATNQIVIFGQKTLQQTASALDRINVRRLLLFLKRRIGKIADTILFEPNVQTTWNNFKRQADAVLADVKSKLGVTEYKLILDESTTTADLIDRNIMYAKIMIKPARAIEYIVVDFIVTRSGVDF